jgi:hypothetical protein
MPAQHSPGLIHGPLITEQTTPDKHLAGPEDPPKTAAEVDVALVQQVAPTPSLVSTSTLSSPSSSVGQSFTTDSFYALVTIINFPVAAEKKESLLKHTSNRIPTAYEQGPLTHRL